MATINDNYLKLKAGYLFPEIGRRVTAFTQVLPREGERPGDSTEVRFLYDEEALYVGARMFSRTGAAGVTSRLVRRDQIREGDTDLFTLTLDTYHDHLGRAIFTVNPSGVKADALAQGGGHQDASWDPIWEAAASRDEQGWTAEIRIPLSQLRFSRSAMACTSRPSILSRMISR